MPALQLKRRATHRSGLSQLTLVEHSLCPLDARASRRANFSHTCQYRYVDPEHGPSTARVTVAAHEGLSARDEFYLWGLLGLTFAQQEPELELHVTPHFCLRQFGLVEPDSKGGESYRLFREAVRRLSAVRYQNDRFYHPTRREHRDVSFGFFSYSLPIDAASSRAWRLVWDPLFFEICQAAGSQLGFDLATYRQLDPASRRLYLVLKKVFWRRESSPRFDLRELAVDTLGFSADLESWRLKQKLRQCAEQLMALGIVRPEEPGSSWLTKRGDGGYAVQFQRGPNINSRQASDRPSVADSTLYDPLRAIGFGEREIAGILRRFSPSAIRLWSDVTLAAMEHKGTTFFRKGPQAFFFDNLKAGAAGGRTAPDWFVALRKEEEFGSTNRRRSDRRKTDGLGEEQTSGPGGLHKAIQPDEVEAVIAAMLGSMVKKAPA